MHQSIKTEKYSERGVRLALHYTWWSVHGGLDITMVAVLNARVRMRILIESHE